MPKTIHSTLQWVAVVLFIVFVRILFIFVLPLLDHLPYGCYSVCALFMAPGGIEAGILTAFSLSVKKPWWQFFITYIVTLFIAVSVSGPYLSLSNLVGYYQTTLILSPYVMIPHMILGVSGALWYRVFIQRMKFNLRPHTKSIVLLSLLLALYGLTISGNIFSGVHEKNYDDGYHYYIHRGFPITFSGTTAEDTRLPSYVLALPFFQTRMSDVMHTRILHIPAMFLSYGIFVFLSLPFAAAIRLVFKKQKNFMIIVGLLIIVIIYQLLTWGVGI